MTGQPAIHTEARGSRMLRLLATALPHVLPRLREPAAWAGWWLFERDGGSRYLRVVCRDELRIGATTLVVAIHLFEQAGHRVRMHNHRWPLAVLPFASENYDVQQIYVMPWERRDGGRTIQAGEFVVVAGGRWAIEDCSGVFHAVHSRIPHGSLNVTDISNSPGREDRLANEPAAEVDIVRAVGIAAVRVPALS